MNKANTNPPAGISGANCCTGHQGDGLPRDALLPNDAASAGQNNATLHNTGPGGKAGFIGLIQKFDRVIFVLLAGLLLLALFNRPQFASSTAFMAEALVSLAPFILLSVVMTAYVNATGADNLIARAFQGNRAAMIVFAALMGVLSPFCSCGVIPLIAALLGMGVPLSAVMAFWLASPLMDPSMMILTIGALGFEFAMAKLIIAAAIGSFGGFAILFLETRGLLKNPLREGIGNGGCGSAHIRNPQKVTWKFWREKSRIDKFVKSAKSNLFFLGKWLALAFFLESLMLAYIPAESIVSLVGGGDFASIALATMAGVPAYLNGYAALPLVAGLMEQGMSAGAGMAFLIGGGVTSIPAAMAVWALARFPVFVAYISLSLAGAFVAGMLFQAWTIL